MTAPTPHRNADGILSYMRIYMKEREIQAARLNSRLDSFIGDITWIQLQSLRLVLLKPKAFGGEKHQVADVLAGPDDLRRKAVLGTTDQNSILYEIINRPDENSRKVSDTAIHDMRTYFRAVDPALENVVTLIQHWIVWDLPDASDLHYFDEQARRIDALCGMEISEELRNRYRPVLHKQPSESVTDEAVLNYELGRMESAVVRFRQRRAEDEPYQLILSRGEDDSSEPIDFKGSQIDGLVGAVEAEKGKVQARISP